VTVHREIEEQAALWVLRREEPDWSPSDEAELDRWLRESDSHKVAFWRLEHGWREADRIASIGVAAPRLSAERPSSRWRPLAGLVAAAASLALVFAVFMLRPSGLPIANSEIVKTAQFATDVGGRKTVSLPDGSRVELNTGTAIRAAVGDEERAVWLDRGEAFFDVASRDGSRFVVYAGGDTITVLGTSFSVRREDRKLTVAVLEGRVRLNGRSGSGEARSAVASAGELAVIGGATIVLETGATAAIERQLAWRTGMLVFDDTALADAAAEFNRYNRQRLVIRDQKSARTRIGGTFRATSVGDFARLLEDAYGLEVTVTSDTISISS
jgi:transmembrane sensor